MSEEKNKVIKAGAGLTIGNYLVKGLVFLTAPLFSRIMSTSDYGLYSTFITYEGILYVVICLGLNSSYRSAWYKYGIEKNGKINYFSYVSMTVSLILFNTLLWFGVTSIIGGKISDILILDKKSLILLVLYSSAMAILACFSAHSGLKYDSKSYIQVSAANSVLNIFLSLVLILFVFPEKSYYGRIFGTTLAAVLVALFVIIKLLKLSKPCFDLDAIKWGLSYSLPIIPYGISLVLLSTFDRIMINIMVGTSATGIYSFAYNIFALVNVTAISLDNVWSPWLYGKMNDKDYKSIRRIGSIYILLMLLFSSIIILISPELVKLIGVKEYWEAQYSVIPIVSGGFFSFLCSLPVSVEYYYEKTKGIAAISMIAGCLNVVLNYIFIKQYGYIAAAYTTLFTYFVYFVIHYFKAKRAHMDEDIFNDSTFLFCTIFITFITYFSNMFIRNVAMRVVFAIILIAIFIYIEEKQIGILKKIYSHCSRSK